MGTHHHDHRQNNSQDPHHHGHHHGHSHRHDFPTNFNFAFAVGISLNLLFVFVETVYGFLSHSMALLAEAGHNIGDVGGLTLAWGASYLVLRAPSKRFTYGLRRSSILAALFNALILLIAIGAICLESIHRLSEPHAISETTVMWVAALGILVNGFTAMLFARGRTSDINIRGAFLHMAADAVISVGVVVAAVIIKFTGWYWVDPAVSLAIAAIIAYGTWDLFRSSLRLAMDAVPESIDPVAVRTALQNLGGVKKIHDLHIWAMSTTEIALTVHLVIPAIDDSDAFLHKAAHFLEEKFGIKHSTIQIERGDGNHNCHLESDDVV